MFYKLYDLFNLVIKPENLIVDGTYGRYTSLVGLPKDFRTETSFKTDFYRVFF